jgi:hypothetical protein
VFGSANNELIIGVPRNKRDKTRQDKTREEEKKKPNSYYIEKI